MLLFLPGNCGSYCVPAASCRRFCFLRNSWRTRDLCPLFAIFCKNTEMLRPMPLFVPSVLLRHAGIPATPVFSIAYFITCGHPGWGGCRGGCANGRVLPLNTQLSPPALVTSLPFYFLTSLLPLAVHSYLAQEPPLDKRIRSADPSGTGFSLCAFPTRSMVLCHG